MVRLVGDVLADQHEKRAIARHYFSGPQGHMPHDTRNCSDQPQAMIGLLVTGDGVPIAHRVFDNTTETPR